MWKNRVHPKMLTPFMKTQTVWIFSFLWDVIYLKYIYFILGIVQIYWNVLIYCSRLSDIQVIIQLYLLFLLVHNAHFIILSLKCVLMSLLKMIVGCLNNIGVESKIFKVYLKYTCNSSTLIYFHNQIYFNISIAQLSSTHLIKVH